MTIKLWEVLYLDKIWDRGGVTLGYDPAKYRFDPYGRLMHRQSYGQQTEMGWEVDHIVPAARGGTDNLDNLQPLHWQSNRQKGDSLQPSTSPEQMPLAAARMAGQRK